MQRHGAWKSASRHSAVRVIGRFTAKLTKRKFAFHHSGKRVVALLLFPGILGAPVLPNLLPADLSILPRNQHGARCSRQKLRTRALAQKPGTDHDFFGKFGADLCGPGKGFSAKQARTCADPSIQTRNLPRTTVLSAKQARTLLRAFGNYKGYNRNIPQLEQQAQHSVSLSRTKLSHCMGGREGSNKVV